MRLTLRTLLNWSNQNLSEADAAMVAQKVNESELAKNLKKQIEEIMACQQLPAPELLDGTPKGNANATAEYLENSMDSKITPEFEKFCIHSEIMLGEIACCHQILSQVLTQKLELAPELRVKLCNLFQFIDANDESSIPPLPQSQTEPELEELFDEIPEASSEAIPEVTQEVKAAPAENELSRRNPWQIAFFALLGLDVLYFLGHLFGLIP